MMPEWTQYSWRVLCLFIICVHHPTHRIVPPKYKWYYLPEHAPSVPRETETTLNLLMMAWCTLNILGVAVDVHAVAAGHLNRSVLLVFDTLRDLGPGYSVSWSVKRLLSKKKTGARFRHFRAVLSPQHRWTALSCWLRLCWITRIPSSRDMHSASTWQLAEPTVLRRNRVHVVFWRHARYQLAGMPDMFQL